MRWKISCNAVPNRLSSEYDFLAYVMIYSYQHRDYAKIKKVIDELKTGTINCDRW